MSEMSLADKAVRTLAAVQAMDANTTNDQPQRHTVRALKRSAEATLEAAFRQANDLAWLAKDLQALVKELTDVVDVA